MKKLAVANGNYEKDGQTKTRWVNVGVIMEKDGKEFALIDPTINFAAFPREEGKDMVMVGVFEEQQNNNSQQQQQQPQYNNNQQNNSQQQQNNQRGYYDNNGNWVNQ